MKIKSEKHQKDLRDEWNIEIPSEDLTDEADEAIVVGRKILIGI